MLALRPQKHQAYYGRGAHDGHLDFHTAPELCTDPVRRENKYTEQRENKYPERRENKYTVRRENKYPVQIPRTEGEQVSPLHEPLAPGVDWVISVSTPAIRRNGTALTPV